MLRAPTTREQLRECALKKIDDGYAINFILDCLPEEIPKQVDEMLLGFLFSVDRNYY